MQNLRQKLEELLISMVFAKRLFIGRMQRCVRDGSLESSLQMPGLSEIQTCSITQSLQSTTSDSSAFETENRGVDQKYRICIRKFEDLFLSTDYAKAIDQSLVGFSSALETEIRSPHWNLRFRVKSSKACSFPRFSKRRPVAARIWRFFSYRKPRS